MLITEVIFVLALFVLNDFFAMADSGILRRRHCVERRLAAVADEYEGIVRDLKLVHGGSPLYLETTPETLISIKSAAAPETSTASLCRAYKFGPVSLWNSNGPLITFEAPISLQDKLGAKRRISPERRNVAGREIPQDQE